MQQPEDCATMAELRAEIDRIDAALVALLARRVRCIDRAIVLKAESGLPARIVARVDQVLENVRRNAARDGLPIELAERLWRDLVDWSIAREEAALGSGPAAGEGTGEDQG